MALLCTSDFLVCVLLRLTEGDERSSQLVVCNGITIGYGPCPLHSPEGLRGRTIRKELEDVGITIAAFDANKNFIFEWFMSATTNGAFEERLVDDRRPTAEPYEDSSDE